MPHVNLPGSVSLFYEMHTPTGEPDPTKPSLLLLAPSWCNVCHLDEYISEFKHDYSICAIELRSHGRSVNPVNASYDWFVAAADLAFAMEALRLPPSHVFGAGVQAFQAALKLAILFPAQVLSLSLAGLSSLFSVPRHLKEFEEVDKAWHDPADEDEWIECVGGVGQFQLTEYDGYEGAWDRVLGPVVRLYNPYKARNIWMSSEPNHRHSRITPERLGEIEQPILLIQGGKDMCFPAADVQDMAEYFTKSKDLRFHIEPNGPQLVAITHAPSVIRRIRSFLTAHPSYSPTVVPLDARQALERAAEIAGDPKIALRNPHAPDSFSLLSAEELAAGQRRLDEMLAQEKRCRLELPMCFEKNDWDEGADKQRRWKWSTRAEYAQRHEQLRPMSVTSLGDGIVVEVQQSETTGLPRSSSNMTGTRATVRSMVLDSDDDDDDDVPPPLPSKIRV
ncbi:hypothetical protein JCM10450v2_001138 [Rhodotorula kratochvilovae]